MSASREKKQRQGAGPSEKAAQARREQAQRKRKTVTYTVIGVVVSVLVAALLIWNTKFFQSRATAATLGEESLTTAELSYYYYDARSFYAAYGSMMGYSYDPGVADDEQYQNEEEGVTWRDYLLDEALTTARTQLAACSAALDAGHTAADVKDGLDESIAAMKSAAMSSGYSYAAYLRARYGPYMNARVYEQAYTRFLLAELANNDKYNELYNGYSQADLEGYYAENAGSLDTFEYSYLYFTPAPADTTDEDGNELDSDAVAALESEALAKAKADADAALAAYEDGATVAQLIEDYALSDSADHTTAVGSDSINPLYSEELLALNAGEGTIVENSTSGYYLVALHSRTLAADLTRDVRHILVRAETTTDDDGNTVEPTDEAWAAALERMESIQAEYEAGERTEDSFAALANQHSDDGDGTTGGLYERRANGGNGGFVPEFNDWVFDAGRSQGDVGLVRHMGDPAGANEYWGYHLIYYVGENEPVWMGTARDSMAKTDRSDWQDELSGSYETALGDGAKYLGT